MNAALSLREPDPLLAAAAMDQFSVVREMLGTLETLTSAGQQYLMGKIIGFMEGQAGGLPRVGARNRRTFMELLTNLRRESDRAFPDISGFVQRTEGLVALLGGGR